MLLYHFVQAVKLAVDRPYQRLVHQARDVGHACLCNVQRGFECEFTLDHRQSRQGGLLLRRQRRPGRVKARRHAPLPQRQIAHIGRQPFYPSCNLIGNHATRQAAGLGGRQFDAKRHDRRQGGRCASPGSARCLLHGGPVVSGRAICRNICTELYAAGSTPANSS